jgi:ABC-type multidrug transport system ATPase subunit
LAVPLEGHGQNGQGTPGDPVIRARGVSKDYGTKRVLKGVDFDLLRGRFLLVTGPNGSGKTTLLRLCAGLAAPTAGTLEIAVRRGQSGSSATIRSSTGS